MIEYTWDGQKRLSNLKRHGLDFKDAWQVYEHPDKVTLNSSYSDELRLIDMAEVNGRVRLLVYTVRGEEVRCISFRPANKGRDQRYYYDQIQNR
jgi:uncharacterized DUF497 family protein